MNFPGKEYFLYTFHQHTSSRGPRMCDENKVVQALLSDFFLLLCSVAAKVLKLTFVVFSLNMCTNTRL